MHKDVYDHRENTGDHGTVQKADRADISSEHDGIHLNRHNDITVQQNTKSRSCKDSCNRKKNVFPQNVLRHLHIKETQDFQCRKFSLSLGNINIVQIIKNNKCQHSGRHDQYYDYAPQRTEHAVYHLYCTGCVTDA